jgi:4-methyl-5(b-hydroxyethyl)-thiazole monophosphate biosynthesis
VKGARGIVVQAEKFFADLDFNTVDMIVLPGGHPGYVNLEACAALMEQVDSFHAQKKPLAAICGASAILGRRGILSGSVACVFPGMEGDLAGATVVNEPAVWDGHLITGRGMGCSVDFALAIVASCKGFDYADQMAEKIVFKK